MQDLAEVRAAFVDPEEFWSSPLYRLLSAVVAGDPLLIGVAAEARSGQVPTFAFFGAVHHLLLAGRQHPLGDYYASVAGDAVRPADDDAGNALVAFAREYDAELRELLRTRLVQTNHVQRAMGLRLGLAAVAEHLGRHPAHLLEIGCSAGLVLRHDAYGYQLGDRHFGNRRSPVQLVTEWRSAAAVPDLDAVPSIASTVGIDLNPLHPADPDDRLWLEALVWPEDAHKLTMLRAALELARTRPVEVLAGDGIDMCPQWAAAVPPGEARVVFHCATRMHVPAGRRPAFDNAILDAGEDGPLYRIAIEGAGLVVTGPDGVLDRVYDVEGHLGWVAPRG